MNLNQLRFVRAVVEAGTFTGGAERCYVTQSTLSTGIALLEKELGDRLFVRTTRSVSLTPFGRRLLPLVNDVLDAQASLLEAAESYLDPDVKLARIGLCPLVDTARLEQVLAPFREMNRNVRVVLEQLTGVDARTALEGGEFDLILGPAEAPLAKIERSKVYEDVLVYLPAGRVGRGGDERRPVRLEEIVDDEFLLVHETCGLTMLTRRLFRSRRLPLKTYAGQAVSYQVLEEWARVGVGSAILPMSKLSSPGIGHPIVLGNGHPAMIRFEALWSPLTIRAPHLQALVHHLRQAGEALARRPPDPRQEQR